MKFQEKFYKVDDDLAIIEIDVLSSGKSAS